MYSVSEHGEITERGYVNTGHNKQITLTALCQTYVLDRYAERFSYEFVV